jgi:hypothetical protein
VIGPAASEGPALDTAIVAFPLVPGTIVGVVTAVDKSAEPASVATETTTVLLAGVGSAVAEAEVAEPPVSVADAGAEANTFSGTSTEAEAPLANDEAATVQVIGPAGIGPVQPAGNAAISVFAGGVKVMVTGPAAEEGPLLVAVNVAVVDVPGAAGATATVVNRSVEPSAVLPDTGAVLFAAAGSAVADVAVTDPPPSVDEGAAPEGRAIGTVTSRCPPGGIGPGMLQLIGPAGIVPVQPVGSVVISYPAGGVKSIAIGPAALDGPIFEAVSVALPDVPGTNVGIVAEAATSAEPAPTGTDAGAESFVLFGSAVGDETDVVPPTSVVSGAAEASTISGI